MAQCKRCKNYYDWRLSRCPDCPPEPGENAWTHSRLTLGEIVLTDLGAGVVVGIDLPFHRAWRWVVSINGEEKCFIDCEVKKIQKE
jgi:hypothetical protein